MHSSRMRTARSSSHPGVLHQATPPGADPDARHAGIPPAIHAGIAHPPVNRMTNRCKNITLPQASFAGRKNTNAKNGLYSHSLYKCQCSYRHSVKILYKRKH